MGADYTRLLDSGNCSGFGLRESISHAELAGGPPHKHPDWTLRDTPVRLTGG